MSVTLTPPDVGPLLDTCELNHSEYVLNSVDVSALLSVVRAILLDNPLPRKSVLDRIELVVCQLVVRVEVAPIRSRGLPLPAVHSRVIDVPPVEGNPSTTGKP